MDKIIKIIKEAEKKRHENHVQAGKSVWQFNEFIFNVVENTRNEILREIEDE